MVSLRHHNCNIDILHQLWELAKEVLTQEELNAKWLLAHNIWGRTAWCMAAVMGQLDILHNLWEWAKILLTPEELNNKLFLAKDEIGRTVWHMAVEKGQLGILC